MWRSLGHDLVDFFARAWPPLYSSPSLCKQSESHGHVAKIWGMTLLNFLRVLARSTFVPLTLQAK